MYGSNREIKKVGNGYGMLKMNRMIKGNTLMCIVMWNLILGIMDLIFGH